MSEKMIEEMEIDEFREAGLLWWINQQLHLFGVAIAIDADEDGKGVRMYPAKCKFRGFSQKSNDKGYYKLTQHMKNNVDEFEKDATIEEENEE